MKRILQTLFLGSSKAFDTVDHVILLKKNVVINQQRSFSLDVKIGVPQASTLGSLLINFYNNYLGKISHKIEIYSLCG